jgi:CRP/FNR family transcriptional regulator, cyclic AMP receptor protein
MSMDSGREALRQVPLFADLDDALVADLSAELRTAEFQAGQSIFDQGEKSSALYVLRSGKVKVVRPSDGSEMVLAVFGPGDCFGELSLCDGLPRSAGVVALEPTCTYVLEGNAFDRFVAAHPGAATKVMRVLAVRLRQASERLSDAVFLELSARLAKRLKELLEEHGRPAGYSTEIGVSLTLDEIAALAGGTVAQVETEMRSLTEGGVVDWDGRRVIVRSPELLAERCRGGIRYLPIGHVTVPRWLLEP